MPIAALFLLGLGCGYASAETRCGWLHNPTPANWWLTDTEATWTIMTQGGPEPPGFEHVADISRKRFVGTNRNYGYACACIGGEFDVSAGKVVRITAFKQMPLRVCRSNRALSKP
ncbi:DUF4087 domain-containing protein [Methylosinus sp. Sm6]|uniref:DUF4087 domain-containing protein n=1 Tax=Methylosinus sp. Sm6 TaxID=2866948 RepID=UPI001C99FF0C|nr:DUF4087 domain-containing protein [Methylosinus sp. Sm6]MBY6243339.1 DUF4087 domain-containing protein [Methylosinus sp. Sm6]